MKAKGQLYCAATCFRCVVCSADLKEIPVFCKDDGLFCEDCYKEKYVPRCCKCNGYITEVIRYILMCIHDSSNWICFFSHMKNKMGFCRCNVISFFAYTHPLDNIHLIGTALVLLKWAIVGDQMI